MTTPIALLEARLAAAEADITLFKGMINTSRRVVAARQFKAENDTPSPQIIKCGDCGDLVLGSEGGWQRLATPLTIEASHTGDTDETELHAITVPAGRMGLNGILKIFASFRGMGAGLHTVRVRFGGVLVRRFWSANTELMAGFVPTYLWNRGAANSQGSGILWSDHDRVGEPPFSEAIDTTANVDIAFTVENAAADETSYLRLAVAELCNGNG